jgi:hypothetical protein
VEFAPTGLALTDEAAAKILVGASHDLKGHWDRFTILVYKSGGRIFFKEVDPQTFEAAIEF